MNGYEVDDGPLRPTAPYVVIFFYDGNHLRARVRDVHTQEQWILDEAQPLRALLTRPAG